MRPTKYMALIERYRALDASDPAALDRKLRFWVLVGEAVIPIYVLASAIVTGLGGFLVTAALLSSLFSGPRRVKAVILGLLIALFGFIAMIASIGAWRSARLLDRSSTSVREGAPRLAALIDDVARRLGLPPPDTISWHPGLNASTTAKSSFLPGGRPRIEMVIGTALLEMLTLPQLEAVIAHELGHHQPGRCAWRRRLYSVLRFFDARLSDDDEDALPFDYPLKVFWKRYAPRAHALDQAIALEGERVADRVSAQAAGATAACDALMRMAMFAPGFEELARRQIAWNAAERLDPQVTVEEERAYFRTLPGDHERRALVSELRAVADPAATHPSLSERIAVMGGRPKSADELIRPDETRAADVLLVDDNGEPVPLVAWRLEIEEAMLAQSHEALQEYRTRHAAAAAEVEALGAAGVRDVRDEAVVMEWLDTAYPLIAEREEFKPLLLHATRLAPRNGVILAQAASRLLEIDDADGLEFASRARSVGCAPAGLLGTMMEFHQRHGDERTAASLRDELFTAVDHESNFDKWLDRVIAKGLFEPSTLPPTAITVIHEGLCDASRVRRAWTLRGTAQEGPEMHLLIIEPLRSWYRTFFSSSRRLDPEMLAEASEAMNRLGVPPLVLVDMGRLSRRARRRLKRVAPQPIYDVKRDRAGAATRE